MYSLHISLADCNKLDDKNKCINFDMHTLGYVYQVEDHVHGEQLYSVLLLDN